MVRSRGSNGERLVKTEKDVANIKKGMQEMNEKINDLQQQQESQLERNILDDLDMETYLNSGRPLYTYEDIAKRWGTTKSKVQKVAETGAFQIRRKGKKIM